MRRVLALAVAGGLAAASLILLSDPQPSDPGLPMEPAPSRVAACPVRVERGGGSILALASAQPGDVLVTAFAGGRPTGEVTATVDAAGGATVASEELVAGGVVGALLEFSTAESRAAIVDRGFGLAAGGCTPPGRSILVAPGGSTRSGEQLDLLLINPHAIDAVVEVISSSEEGLDSASELESVLVPAGSVLVRDLASLLPLRQRLSVSILVDRGSVHAFLAQAGEGDSMIVEAVPPAAEWWIPLPSVTGAEGHLVLANPSPVPVEVVVDLFVDGGPIVAASTIDIAARSHAELPLEELGDGVEGVHLSASSPMVGGLVFTGPGVRAAGPGLSRAAASWLIPGPSVGGEARLWILNPADVDAEVVTQPLRPGAEAPTVVVPAGSVRGVPVEARGSGYLVRSSVDVVVSWTGIDSGLALAGAAPVEE